jgi:hypothetical protein
MTAVSSFSDFVSLSFCHDEDCYVSDTITRSVLLLKAHYEVLCLHLCDLDAINVKSYPRIRPWRPIGL